MAKKFGLVSVIFTSIIVSILLLFFFTYIFVSQRDTWCAMSAPMTTMMDQKMPVQGMPMEKMGTPDTMKMMTPPQEMPQPGR